MPTKEGGRHMRANIRYAQPLFLSIMLLGTGCSKAKPSPIQHPKLQKAVSNYYAKRGLTEGFQTVTCDLYGSTTKITIGLTANDGGFVPKGADVYDCAPLNDTSITICFAIVDGEPHDINGIRGPGLKCSGKRPIASKSGKYLPATPANVIRLIKDDFAKSEVSPDLNHVTFTVDRRIAASRLPDRTDPDANHWFHATWTSNNATYDYDVNPWTHEVYQASLSITISGPSN